MSEKKSITIASDSLLGGSSSKRKSSKRSMGSGERKIRPSSIVQPSTLKKTLLERIKQHQRTRERSRRDDSNAVTGDDSVTASASASASASDSATAPSASNDNFTQSIDFLRKLAMKRRQQQQHTQRRVNSSSSSSSSSMSRFPEAKTPEAKMMNQVAETLHHGEILTNTGLLGLPVVSTIVPSAPISPMISLGPMPFQPVMTTSSSFFPEVQTPAASSINTTPNITQLADMYNNTIASAEAATTDAAAAAATTTTTTGSETNEPPLHIPTKPEDYLPSIFIKEAPPHGCLKNGKKPTFREWATNMLKKPVDTIKDMMGGGDGASSGNNDSEQSGGGSIGGSIGGGIGGGIGGSASASLNPDQVAGMRVKIRKTNKKRFRIGKHDDVVGVLLKNKQTQRHIQSQHLALKQKTIGEIRKYLYEHHLLKVGSNAPPDVLRRMYEDAILTGEVKNTNNDVLLHNFMSGGGGE
jgi:hypothetical protein